MSLVDGSQSTLVLMTQKFDEMLTANFCAVAATTLIFYDYLLTLSDEIRCVWKSKFSIATVLFMLNRYVIMLYRTLMVVQFLSWESYSEEQADTICRELLRLNEGVTIIVEVSVALFIALRLYAIWDFDRRIFLLIFTLSLAPPIINIYYYTKIDILATPYPFTGCGEIPNINANVATFLSIFNRVFAIVTEAIILAFTWVRTTNIMRSHQLGMESICRMIRRDGTLYFVSMLALNVINLVAIKAQRFGSVPAIADVVTSILVTRFLLNLRGIYAVKQISTSESFHPSNMADLVFDRHSTGNLGAPLNDSSSYHNHEALEDREEIHSLDPFAVGILDTAPKLPGLFVDEDGEERGESIWKFNLFDDDGVSVVMKNGSMA